jgi:hypothetical protein
VSTFVHVTTGSDTMSEAFHVARADEIMPRLSPDCRWLADVSNESGGAEGFVCAFRDPGDRAKVSANGGGSECQRSVSGF